MKKLIAFLFAVIMLLGIMACSSSDETVVSTEPVTTTAESATVRAITFDMSNIPEETEEVIPEGYMKSYLTGELVTKEVGMLRPVGFQVDNERKALPQCGISKADVVYEVPIEAYEVRLTAIFQDMSGISKIGPLRSARSYHPGILAEYDGIFFHNGHSNLALTRLDDPKCDDIEAVDRDYNAKFVVSGWASGHDDFTSPEKVEARIEYRDFRRNLTENYTYKFKFASASNPNMLEDGYSAKKVSTNIKQNHSYFVYNEDDGLYYRYAYDTKCIDGNNDKQVAVKNIILQYCTYNLEWDKDTKNLHTVGTDYGKFITNGKAVDITWEKEDYWENTHYYYMDGTEIELNPGQTWVSMLIPSLHDWPTIE